MHQTKKGNAWHFGLKAHVGVDAASGLVHTVSVTGAHVADVAEAHRLLHGEEKTAFADAGYQGVEKRPEMVARDLPVQWHIAVKRSRVKALAAGALKTAVQALEKTKAQVRALVEHPFHVLKNLFRYRKARYRGLAKNGAQLQTLFALANLVLAGRTLRAELRP
jgi:IS5 family transposase